MAETTKKTVKLDAKTTIVAKAGAKHMTPGKEYSVHPHLADNLIKAGKAEKPKKSKKEEE